MRRHLVYLSIAATMAVPLWAGSFKISGSSNMLTVTNALIAAYTAQHPETKVSVNGVNSELGIADLIEGNAEVAASTRPLKPAERAKLPTAEVVLVGHDGVGILLHADNPVKSLSIAQLEGIFCGTTTNWKQVGGRDAAIHVYTREEGAAKAVLLRRVVLRSKPFTKEAKVLTHRDAMLAAVAGDPNAIGFGASVHPAGVKTAALVPADSPFPQMPTPAAVASGTYPLVENLYYVTKSSSPEIRGFLDFATSPEGQAIVAKAGSTPRLK